MEKDRVHGAHAELKRRLAGIFHSRWGAHALTFLNAHPRRALALCFLLLIALGTILLMLPAATVDGRGASFINALFTMTSASCLAGLSVYHLGSEFSRFGQGVVLLGMQAGGLTIMVLSAAFAALVGGSIASRKQTGLTELLDISTPECLKRLLKTITLATLSIELVGALLLFILWNNELANRGERIWWSVFHAVSAFCNAGLSLFSNSLESFATKPATCFVVMALVTAGGLGFFVLVDLCSPRVWEVRRPRAMWDRLQIQSKVVIVAYLVLDGCGLLFFLFFEFDGTLHGLSIPNKIIAALFHVVNMRSSGFSIVPLGNLAAPTMVFCLFYMFIGAAPGSTGGGVKVTTAAISLMALRTTLRARVDVEIFNRRLAPSLVHRSMSIVFVAAIFLAIFLTMLLATQGNDFERLLFECVSALGSVGFSLDTTATLNDIGKVLVICAMYLGRIGPLMLAMAIGERRRAQQYHLPLGRIAVG